MTNLNTNTTVVQKTPKNPIFITLEQSEAKRIIQIAGKVSDFVAFLQITRSTATRQLFYEAFGSRFNDSPLLEWVRDQAIKFTASLPYHSVINETGATNE